MADKYGRITKMLIRESLSFPVNFVLANQFFAQDLSLGISTLLTSDHQKNLALTMSRACGILLARDTSCHGCKICFHVLFYLYIHPYSSILGVISDETQMQVHMQHPRSKHLFGAYYLQVTTIHPKKAISLNT